MYKNHPYNQENLNHHKHLNTVTIMNPDFRTFLESYDILIFRALTPLSAIFQLYHGDQF
jgi:16S rRNA G527 N7-methylase RsmG